MTVNLGRPVIISKGTEVRLVLVGELLYPYSDRPMATTEKDCYFNCYSDAYLPDNAGSAELTYAHKCEQSGLRFVRFILPDDVTWPGALYRGGVQLRNLPVTHIEVDVKKIRNA